MHQGRFIFSQLIKHLPKRAFDCLVNKYEGNKYVKSFTCWNHLLVLIIGQLSNRESVTRSNLSKANEMCDARIFKEFSERMISVAQEKEADLSAFFSDNDIYAFDSSTITFCTSAFWWSKPVKNKGGVKLHTLYDK